MKSEGKYYFLGLTLVIGLWVIAAVGGCGQQTTSTTTTTIPGATGVTISGNLYSGAVRASAVNAAATGTRRMSTADSPLNGYNVVAVGTVDDKIYFPTAKTAADGAFSIAVPSGESFYLEVIDDQGKFVAPVSFGSAAGGVVMAVTPEAGTGPIDLGKISYDSAKGAAAPTQEVAAPKLDAGSTAKAKSGETFVPVGTGVNLGRGTEEAKFTGTLKDKVDEDNDGLPDVVDIDDNGDGKVDGLDPTPRLATRVEVKIAGVNNTNAFSNLALPYENYPTYQGGSLNNAPIDVAAQTNLAIEVVMTPGTDPATFSDVRVVDGPAWINTATIASDSPPNKVGTPWKDSQNILYKSSDRWTVHVTPNGTPEAGDVLKFAVTTSTGTQEFIATLSYVFKDIPRLVAYSDTAGTKEGASVLNLAVYQANSNKFDYTGSAINLIWTAPKDDTGAYITGMQYYLDGINYYDAGGVVVRQAGSLAISPTAISDPTFGDVNLVTFTPTTEAFTYFKVDIKAQSPASGGGNASQMVNFKKI